MLAGAATASAQTEIQWWHSMTGALNDRVNELAKGYNESQKEFRVVPVYKGAYPESMAAAIAAFRAGNAPHILQVFEVGTATMMSAKGAIKPVAQVMREGGQKFDPKSYIGAVAGYYTTTKGEMLSFPFNSSTPVFYYNKDVFEKAGLDASRAPATWPEVMAAAAKIKAAGASQCAYTTGWPSWVHVENFSAWHNVPIATKENGMAGLDTEFKINTPLHVRHWNNLKEWNAKGYFTYAGRRNEAEAKFYSGECAMLTSSSAAQANINRNAKFKYGVAMMPYYADVAGAPQNSIIGGASLWVMSGKKPNDYKGVAQFLTYLAEPKRQAQWHQQTGYLPITPVAFDLTKSAGFYDKNPGTDVSVRQMMNKPPTANSKGLRFGSFVQIRDMFEEEFENMLAGKQDAKTALDNSVRRGNEMLRRFEKQAKE
ncbi:MAG: sn-glycerol-3-phosphate ABC transporter substrate-binding protein UgpB, partial [Burkholderiaceae bacterium]|nr:sn-glycerol-3-phosphate ABC transporter substrate-binding protein UgpB [Burkholderiaceae bacterium]